MTQFPPGFYKMRNGEKAEVLAERDGLLFGRRVENSKTWDWTIDGRFLTATDKSSQHDLISPWIEPVKPFECWVNRYRHTDGGDYCINHNTKQSADASRYDRIGPAIHMRQVIDEEGK